MGLFNLRRLVQFLKGCQPHNRRTRRGLRRMDNEEFGVSRPRAFPYWRAPDQRRSPCGSPGGSPGRSPGWPPGAPPLPMAMTLILEQLRVLEEMLDPVHAHAMSRQYISGAWRAEAWQARTEPLRARRLDLSRRIDIALATAAAGPAPVAAAAGSLVSALAGWDDRDWEDELMEEPDDEPPRLDEAELVCAETLSDLGDEDSDSLPAPSPSLLYDGAVGDAVSPVLFDEPD